jgi:hypothetical protein
MTRLQYLRNKLKRQRRTRTIIALFVFMCYYKISKSMLRSDFTGFRRKGLPFDPYQDSLPLEPAYLFRFESAELEAIVQALQLPQIILLPPTRAGGPRNGHKFYSLEGMMILCARLAFPSRWGQMPLLFNSSDTRLAKIYRYMRDLLLSTAGFMIDFSPGRITPLLLAFQAALQRKLHLTQLPHVGACFGFVDMKFWPSSKPRLTEDIDPQHPNFGNISQFQRQLPFFSGYKRQHGLTCLAIMLPNGITLFWGPVEVYYTYQSLRNLSQIFFLFLSGPQTRRPSPN